MGLIFVKSIGKCCRCGIVVAVDIREFDATIFLKFSGPECRTDDRDAP